MTWLDELLTQNTFSLPSHIQEKRQRIYVGNRRIDISIDMCRKLEELNGVFKETLSTPTLRISVSSKDTKTVTHTYMLSSKLKEDYLISTMLDILTLLLINGLKIDGHMVFQISDQVTKTASFMP